jgi:hypothetical protein
MPRISAYEPVAASNEPQFPSLSAVKTPSTTSERDKHDYHESVKQGGPDHGRAQQDRSRNEHLATAGAKISALRSFGDLLAD